MKRAARVENYRGFVFASLAADGPGLLEFLGRSKVAFDDICDRSPEGEVEIVPNCFRVIQHSNWKIILENQLGALHPSVTHQSTGRAAREVELEIEKRTGKIPLSYHMLSAFSTVTIEKWDNFQTLNYPYGHCILTGYMGLRPQDPETLEYERVLAKAYGEKRKEEILSTNIHHVLIYPGLSVQSPLQQLRAVRPLGVDKTLTEIWHFRLKGAPEPIYRRALAYYNLVNSPSTLINADDLENFWKAHQGLSSDGGDWVSFHRHYGRDTEKDGIVETAPNCGTSEAPMRNQMKVRMKRVLHPDAWSQRPLWGTNHVVGNVVVERESPNGDVVARSRFHMMELRRDDVRHFAGLYIHHLKKTKDGYRIKLQRVDMTNAQAAYDYVLQVWV